ncbi:histone-lysine N-methyltransferase SETMAR-like [Halyomorpha halys]|uniref:histone-lysine N-methyltransferase SETMAR-like n=1 Tax=Halyomorpha halys TaxID=286706 RepID=UPI0034D1DCD5
MLVRLTTASSLTSRLKVEPFLNRIITCDEKWVLYNNFRRSYQWLSADEKPKQFPKPDLHPKKVLLIVFWTAKGIVHFEILNQGQTITAEVYCNILDHCQSKLKTFDPCLVNRRRPLLLQDNARPHTAKLTREKLTEIGWEVLPHPPYSPDLSPTDYHLFRDLDNNLRQKCFQDRDNLIHELTTYFCNGTFQEFEEAAAKLGLKDNKNKTVYIDCSRREKINSKALRDHSLNSVNQFKFKGR